MAVLVALEGIDGSGKGTQAARLVETARAAGLRAALFSFPRYDDNPFSRAIGDYLNGGLGSLDEVHPALASVLYAGDRLHAKPELLDAIAANDLVVCDRYVASNLAHQGGRLEGEARARLIAWVEEVEFGEFGLPRPDLVVLLDTSPSLARALVARKAARAYTSLAEDIHEEADEHLAATRAVYRELAARSGWEVVATADAEGELREVDEIAADVWRIVEPRLRR